MSFPVSSGYEAALKEGTRVVRFRAEMFNKFFEPMATPLTLEEGGDVTYEMGAPAGRASFTLLDRNGNLPSADDPVWFARNIKLSVDMKVDGQWERVPLFFGPVQDVVRSGIRVMVDCDTKDVQHLDPHFAARPFSVREHTKLHRAIRLILESRGETRFDLTQVRERLPKNRLMNVGVEPWKVCRSIARDADMQLFYRGNGAVHLRPWPTTAAWRFRDGENGTLVSYPEERLSVGPVRDTFVVIGERTERVTVKKTSEIDTFAPIGATEIHLKADTKFVRLLEAGKKIQIGNRDPETRKIAGTYTPGSRTIPLSRPLERKKGVGAKVVLTVKVDKEVPVVGKASLTQNHKLSSQSLTAGKRPRLEILERPSIHKKQRAQEIAERRRNRVQARYEQAISISTVPIWHLELGDIFVVRFNGVEHRSRIQRITFPLSLGESMELNWAGNRPPPKKYRRRGPR